MDWSTLRVHSGNETECFLKSFWGFLEDILYIVYFSGKSLLNADDPCLNSTVIYAQMSEPFKMYKLLPIGCYWAIIKEYSEDKRIPITINQ